MKKNNGFTIVEVALVLGIAGLIMVMVFVALPALWSSQRDSDRRANVMEFISALKTFQTNNSRGAIPRGGGEYTVVKNTTYNHSSDWDTWNGLIQDYYLKGEQLEDPGGATYKIYVIDECNNPSANTVCEITPADDEFKVSFNDVNTSNNPVFDIGNPIIYVVVGATCDEDSNSIFKTNNRRSIAAVQVLEHGKYCHNT